MAVIHVRTFDTASGSEVPGTGLRTSSPQSAADHANELTRSYSEPQYITRISYAGSFVDEAFADLAQLVQRHGLHLENGDG